MGVEQLQPTKLSRWIAGVTVPLAIGATQLYEALQKVGLTVESLAEPTIRLLLGVGAFSLCMVALNISLVRHILAIRRERPPQAQPPTIQPTPAPALPAKTFPTIRIPKRLDDIDIDILRYLANVRSAPTTAITKSLGKQRALVEFHLVELDKANHVYCTHGTSDTFWYLDQEGRRALVDLKILN